MADLLPVSSSPRNNTSCTAHLKTHRSRAAVIGAKGSLLAEELPLESTGSDPGAVLDDRGISVSREHVRDRNWLDSSGRCDAMTTVRCFGTRCNCRRRPPWMTMVRSVGDDCGDG